MLAAAGPLADHVLASPISPDSLLSHFGLWGLLLVVFAECGLLIGFFLPGDTLLFSAGILLAIGGKEVKGISLTAALILLPIAAIVGNIVGYWIGRSAGPKVFDRPNSKLFRPEYVDRASAFFERFGAATILLARFVPVVRTVATVFAGVSKMRFGLYVLFSIIGGIVWTDGVTLIGYWLGHIEFVRKTVEPLIDPILICVVILSLLPTAFHWWRARRSGQAGAHQAPETETVN